jgi:hypothetical protein
VSTQLQLKINNNNNNNNNNYQSTLHNNPEERGGSLKSPILENVFDSHSQHLEAHPNLS